MITRHFAIALTALALFSAAQTRDTFAGTASANGAGAEAGNFSVIAAAPSQASRRFAAHPPRNAPKPAGWVGLNPQPGPPTVNRRLKGDRLVFSR